MSSKGLVGALIVTVYIAYQVIRELYQRYMISSLISKKSKLDGAISAEQNVIKAATEAAKEAVDAYENAKSSDSNKPK